MYETREKRPALKLTNDLLFKVVYGSDTEDSKFILKSLLNKILNREYDPIVDIKYKNPFNINEYVNEKDTILDIKAETSSEELIDIEMQINWLKEMPRRLLSYHGRLLGEALQKGNSYDRMKQTITICITDSVAFKESEKFLNEFYFIEKEEHFVFSEMTRICCIELPKVNPDGRKPEELSPLEICLEYLRCADENGSEYVDELVRRGGKDLKMAQNILEKATREEILKEKAIAREKYLQDMAYFESRYGRGLEDGFAKGQQDGFAKGQQDGFAKGLEDGHAKGLKEGHAQGLKEGHTQGLKEGHTQGLKEGHTQGLKEGHSQGLKEGHTQAAKEIAVKLKASGLPVEMIAESTGLSVEEIEKL